MQNQVHLSGDRLMSKSTRPEGERQDAAEPARRNLSKPSDGPSARDRLASALEERFGEPMPIPSDISDVSVLAPFAFHAMCRHYGDRALDRDLVRLLCACALSAPSKSDLQQRDIVEVTDPDIRQRIAALMPHMPWVGEAPGFLVFCANGRRLPKIAELRRKPFPNDHLDLFFNAVGDAAIALSTCIHAAESVGLGCCPISEIRNHAAEISDWLNLPERVIPFAGLCIGWPSGAGRIAPKITPRLPLSLTLHENRYQETGFEATVAAYDKRQEATEPYGSQRDTDRWGVSADYGWSEDKARQYSKPWRVEFGRFVRRRGFNLD
jgi:nitroreductase/FMN reductase [NAD(P)H]